ncbi:MAG: hypothetical protein AAFR04_11650 [Pseudomonadota bacterium]
MSATSIERWRGGLKGRWPNPSDWLARLISMAFVAVAGAVAMQMAYASGADEVRRWTMVAVVGAGLAIIAFGPGLTLGRGRYFAALFLLPVWLVVVGYNGLSALEYFDRYLADDQARQKLKQDLYRERRETLQRLRERRAAIQTARPIKTIEAQVTREERTRCRSRCLALKAELQDARAREALDDRIRVAAAGLSRVDVKGSADASRHLRPLFHWLTAVTGVTVVSSADLRALFLLLITELGAALVPVAMALASGRKRLVALQVKSKADPAPTAAPSRRSVPQREDARAVATWLDVRVRQTSGARTPAGDLYADYAKWAEARDQTPATRARFGTILTEDCGLAKRKAGSKWLVNYLGVELKPSGNRYGAPLRAIAGGLGKPQAAPAQGEAVQG